MKLIDQHDNGVFPEHRGAQFLGGWIPTDARMTIPAREAIEEVSETWLQPSGIGSEYAYLKPPAGVIVVAVRTPDGLLETAYRLKNEPAFPGEHPHPNSWLEASFLACPQCGYALVWYEAGYVPGYRVCCGPAHHHYLIEFSHEDEE